MHPFRFGVNVWRASGAEWADKARRIEDLGFSTLPVPDHLGDFFAPIPAAVAAAAATTRLRVGTTVLNNDFRHPVLVAREAATVDVLTVGRAAARPGRRPHRGGVRRGGAALRRGSRQGRATGRGRPDRQEAPGRGRW